MLLIRKKMKRTYSLFLMVLCLIMTCLTQAVATAKPHLLKRGILYHPKHFDPNREVINHHFVEMLLLYEGLVSTDGKGQLIPGAAKRWEVSDDGRTYRFYLREGLKWSDGSPVTIDQFMASFKRVHSLDTKTRPEHYYTPIINSQDIFAGKKTVDSLGIKVIDEQTLEFQLSHPAPYFPELMLTGSFPVPTHIVKDNPEHWAKQLPLVSNGPYQAISKTSHNYHYQKNPHYRKADSVYYIDIKSYSYGTPNKALMDMVRGKLDILGYYSGSIAKSTNLLTQTNLSLLQQPNRTTQYITFNLQDKHLKTQALRQAIMLTLQRQSIAEAITLETGHEAYTFAPTGGSWGWDMDKPDWAHWPITQRIEQAQALMKKQGYTPTRRLKLEFLVNKNASAMKLAAQVKTQLARIWIDLKIIKNDISTHYKRLRQGRFQLARAGWAADYVSPGNFYSRLTQASTSNLGKWHHAEYERLNRSIHMQALDPTQRAKVYQQMEKIIRDEIVIIPINYMPTYTVFSNKFDSRELQHWFYEPLIPYLRPAQPKD